MMEHVDSHPPEEQRPVEDVLTLGSILAAARQRQGLAIEQMAAELRVESRLLEALEADRFEVLPAPVFVKGYLRHLANRFGLEYDDLLHHYTVQTDAKDAPVTYSEPIPEDNKLLVPLIIGALVLILGIPAFWFTWVSRDSLSSIVTPDEAAPVPPPAQVESIPEASPPLPVPGIAVEPAAQQPPAVELDPVQPPSAEFAPEGGLAPGEFAPANELAPGDTSASESISGDAPAAEDGPAAESGETAPTTPEDQPPVEAEPAVEPQPAEPAAAAAAEQGTAPATTAIATGLEAGPPVQVALSYAEDSWTEVSDGNGNSLYYTLGRAGTTANLDGVLPMAFVLGNPLGVQVSINDQPYAVPVPQGNATTVRFVIEEAP